MSGVPTISPPRHLDLQPHHRGINHCFRLDPDGLGFQLLRDLLEEPFVKTVAQKLSAKADECRAFRRGFAAGKAGKPTKGGAIIKRIGDASCPKDHAKCRGASLGTSPKAANSLRLAALNRSRRVLVQSAPNRSTQQSHPAMIAWRPHGVAFLDQSGGAAWLFLPVSSIESER